MPYDPQSLNPYAYARNNPITLSDPTGLICKGKSSDVACPSVNGAPNATPDAPPPAEEPAAAAQDIGSRALYAQTMVDAEIGACGSNLACVYQLPPSEVMYWGYFTDSLDIPDVGPPPSDRQIVVAGAKFATLDWGCDSAKCWALEAAGIGPGKIFDVLKLAKRTSHAAKGGGALVDAGKYDYLFGNVASNAHNAARSAQNAQQLARVGVHNNAAGRGMLQSHFDDVIARNDNITRTFTNEHGTFQIRDSLFSGPVGFLKFESTWQVTDDGFRLSTVIPMGGP